MRTEQPSGQRLSAKRARSSARASTVRSPTSAQSTVERCQLSWPSISATDAPNRCRNSAFSEETSLRLPLRLPDSFQ